MIVHTSPKSFLLAAQRLGRELPVYKKIIGWAGLSHVDRSETLDLGFPIKILEPIPKDRFTAKTFAEVCDDAAIEIIKGDMPIDVAWSGGIDSTAALVALLKAGIDLDRLTILMLPETPGTRRLPFRCGSVAEYPEFFKKYINGKIQWRMVKDVRQEICSDRLMLTGELGDQLFGSIRLFSRFQPYLMRRPYEEVINIDEGLYKIIDILRPFIAASPVPIVSIYDLMWWLNFGLKWQSVSFRMLAPNRFHLYPNMRHFFGTDDFQRWSITNHHIKMQGVDLKSYKMPAKDYIYEFTRDADYRDNKLKERSLPAGGFGAGFCCVFDDLSTLKFGAYSVEGSAFTDEIQNQLKRKMQ